MRLEQDSSPNEGNNGLICTSEGDPIERDLTCEEGETTSPNEGNNGLICTSEGDPIETVNCEEGETGSVTGDILTCTSEGDPVEKDLTCEEGEEASPNEGNTGLICTSEGDPVEL